MTTITPELRQAIAQAGEIPARVVDPETNTSYVLLRADVYERYKVLFEEEGELDVREMDPLLAKVFGPAGWDDPEMDDYDVRELYPHVDRVMAADDADDPALASDQDQGEPKP